MRIISADLNADKHADLVVASGVDVVTVFAGSGMGTFSTARSFAVGQGPTDMAVADLTGDCLLDIVVANGAGNNVTVLRNTTSGASVTPVPTAPPAPTATVGPGTPTPLPPSSRTVTPPRTPAATRQPTGSDATPSSGGGGTFCAMSSTASPLWWLTVLAAGVLVVIRRRAVGY